MLSLPPRHRGAEGEILGMQVAHSHNGASSGMWCIPLATHGRYAGNGKLTAATRASDIRSTIRFIAVFLSFSCHVVGVSELLIEPWKRSPSSIA